MLEGRVAVCEKNVRKVENGKRHHPQCGQRFVMDVGGSLRPRNRTRRRQCGLLRRVLDAIVETFNHELLKLGELGLDLIDALDAAVVIAASQLVGIANDHVLEQIGRLDRDHDVLG